jgi:hypothetical protein
MLADGHPGREEELLVGDARPPPKPEFDVREPRMMPAPERLPCRNVVPRPVLFPLAGAILVLFSPVYIYNPDARSHT